MKCVCVCEKERESERERERESSGQLPPWSDRQGSSCLFLFYSLSFTLSLSLVSFSFTLSLVLLRYLVCTMKRARAVDPSAERVTVLCDAEGVSLGSYDHRAPMLVLSTDRISKHRTDFCGEGGKVWD